MVTIEWFFFFSPDELKVRNLIKSLLKTDTHLKLIRRFMLGFVDNCVYSEIERNQFSRIILVRWWQSNLSSLINSLIESHQQLMAHLRQFYARYLLLCLSWMRKIKLCHLRRRRLEFLYRLHNTLNWLSDRPKTLLRPPKELNSDLTGDLISPHATKLD